MRTPKSLTGLVIDRRSPLYDQARLEYNTGLSQAHPLYIVFCQNVQDIRNAVRWARRHRVPVRARSGRHSYENYSVVDDGVVIDVSPLNDVSLDPESGLATVGAGTELLPLYQALWDQGPATIPGGTCASVGIGGLTLGGGFGLTSRLFGLTCDALESLEMVTASGDIVRANSTENRSLFWASCGGGGGNFGIVSSFTFKTFPIGKVTTFIVQWPWRQLTEVMKAFQRWADPEWLDRRVSPVLNATSERTGQVVLEGEFVGPPDQCERVLAPLLEDAPPNSVSLRHIDFIDAAHLFSGVAPPNPPPGFTPLSGLMLPHPFSNDDHKMFKNTSAYQFRPFPDEAVDTVVRWLAHAPGANDLVEMDVYGGAVSDRGNHDTAFPHRQGVRSILQYQAYWDDPSEAFAHIRWVEDFRRAMLPWTRDSYINYMDRNVRPWPEGYYNGNLKRLLHVKQAYDPHDVFDFPRGLGRLIHPCGLL